MRSIINILSGRFYENRSILRWLAVASFLFVLFAFLPRRNRNRNSISAQKGLTTVSLGAIAGLQYDQVRFMVRPGARVKIVFTNKDDMSHNFVITMPGKRLDVVNAAIKLEEKGPSMDYIPHSADILWSVPVLSPGQVRSVTFIAPEDTGVYPYVCTFPGHGFSMYGAMYVLDKGEMPELPKDENIPPARRDGEKMAESHGAHGTSIPRVHPYDPTPPYLYRAYMADASPAAIAVRLPNDLAYCWDAGSCDLRYAWKGDFLDNTAFWKGKPNAEAEVLGTVFYRSSVKQPLRLGAADRPPTVDFKGYRLIDRYPEFHYALDGTDVYELIRSTEEGDGLICNFRIPEGKKGVWFIADPGIGMTFRSSAGKWDHNRLWIPLSDIKKFSIVMTKMGGQK